MTSAGGKWDGPRAFGKVHLIASGAFPPPCAGVVPIACPAKTCPKETVDCTAELGSRLVRMGPRHLTANHHHDVIAGFSQGFNHRAHVLTVGWGFTGHHEHPHDFPDDTRRFLLIATQALMNALSGSWVG